jgi:hypothetical protein
MDRALGTIFLLGCVPTFIVAYRGYERFIRATQQNVEAGVRDYNELSRNHLVFASVNAYNMLTKEPLTGTVELVGALNPHTLVFRGADRRLHTMGKEFQADFVLRSILCEKGGSAHSSIRSVDLSDHLLAELLSSLDTSAEHFLFGDLTVSEKVSLPENIRVFTPVAGAGELIKFNYATCDDIRACNLEQVLVTKGIVTVKTIVTSGAMLRDTTHDLFRAFDAYARVASLIDPGDSVVILKQRGDTVRENEVLALKTPGRLFQEERSLLETKRNVLADKAAEASSVLEGRIAEARLAVGADSADRLQSAELLQNGFIAEEVYRVSERKWFRNRRTLAALVGSKAAAEAGSALELNTLTLAIGELDVRAARAGRQSEVRSTAEGLVMDVRTVPRGGKKEIVFIVQRLR